MEKNQDFSWALIKLKEGRIVCRSGWNGKGMFLYIDSQQLPCKWGDKPFPISTMIIMKTADDLLTPWVASQTDLLVTDWEVVE
jgi:hypothetical protein